MASVRVRFHVAPWDVDINLISERMRDLLASPFVLIFIATRLLGLPFAFLAATIGGRETIKILKKFIY